MQLNNHLYSLRRGVFFFWVFKGSLERFFVDFTCTFTVDKIKKSSWWWFVDERCPRHPGKLSNLRCWWFRSFKKNKNFLIKKFRVFLISNYMHHRVLIVLFVLNQKKYLQVLFVYTVETEWNLTVYKPSIFTWYNISFKVHLHRDNKIDA